MPDDIQFVALNADEVLRKLDRTGVVVRELLEKATEAGADIIHDEAEKNAPGPHIETAVAEKKDRKVSIDVGPDKEHWYYKYFETGTQPHEVTPQNRQALLIAGEKFAARAAPSGMPATPFLRPAVDGHGKEAAEAIAEIILTAFRGISSGG